MPTRRASTWLDDQRKDYINPKGSKQRNCSKKLLTDNLPTNNGENTNSRNKGKYLLLAKKAVDCSLTNRKMPQRIQRHSRITLHRSTHPKWTRKLLETKLNSRNLIKGINTWAVPLLRYSGPFLKWTRDELKQMDRITRKLMTMPKALHPRDDVDRLYASRKEGGRGLASIEDSVDTSIHRLENYIQKHEGGLITATRHETENTMNNRKTITRKQKWEGKQLYGRFKRLINNISHDKTWTWLRKGNFKRETESLLIAVQDNAIRTNHIKARIDKTQQNSKCRLCGDRDETINHIIRECSKLALL